MPAAYHVYLTLADIYRIILVAELFCVEAAYGWAAWRYFKQMRHLTDPGLKSARIGVFERVLGCEFILLLFTTAVVRRFGEENVGSLVFNLWLQVVMGVWLAAWIRVDRRRFLHIERDIERSEAAMSALERVEIARARQEQKARERRGA